MKAKRITDQVLAVMMGIFCESMFNELCQGGFAFFPINKVSLGVR